MQEFAYITGGASGIGLSIAKLLTRKGIKVFLVDRNKERLEEEARALSVPFAVGDVLDWEFQVKAFKEAIHQFGRIDYVYCIAGIAEKSWLLESELDFAKPDLLVLDTNVTGLLYTLSLAIQQFRKQPLGPNGFKGKVLCAGSVCGIYCCSSIPIYTASKHAITGLVRSYGKQLANENITLNAVCPNVVRTNISTPAFYDSLDDKGLLTPMEGVLEACEKTLGPDNTSGECFEVGPDYPRQGLTKPAFAPFTDDHHKAVFEKLEIRGNAL